MSQGTLSLWRNAFFPSTRPLRPQFKHRALVGIGGNEGKVVERFGRLMRYWMNCRLVHVVETSPLLKNPPFGYTDQPDFFNALAWVQTSLSPQAFLKHLLHVEKHFGRVRSFKYAPRTLDLDLIFFDAVVLNTPRLILPHPHWSQRLSVTLPLGMMEHKGL